MKPNPTAPTPNGKWRWKDSVTGATIVNFSAPKLIIAVRVFLANNGRPPLTAEEVGAQICNQMGLMPPYCDEVSAVPPEGVTLEKLGRFFSTFKNWLLDGVKLAPMEEVNRRADICVKCPRNQRAGGCSSCDASLGAIIGQDMVLPEGRFPDKRGQLHNCQQCGCRLSLKIQLPMASFKDDTAKYPEWCWMND